MMSTHYAEARDGNFHSFEVDALFAPVKQYLIGGQRGKLCSVEQSIPFISDILRLFRTNALYLANAAEVNVQPLNETTNGKKF